MRYVYVLIVMTAMIFVAAGSSERTVRPRATRPEPPSKSCPPHYTWNNSKALL